MLYPVATNWILLRHSRKAAVAEPNSSNEVFIMPAPGVGKPYPLGSCLMNESSTKLISSNGWPSRGLRQDSEES